MDDLTGAMTSASTPTGPMARNADPGTSWIAAATAKANMRTELFRTLAGLAAGDANHSELAARTGQHPPTASRRLTDLGRKGLAELTGSCRPTSTGSPGRVWRITQAGLDLLIAEDAAPAHRGTVAPEPTAVSTILRERYDVVGQTSLFDPPTDDRWSSQWGKVRP